MKKILLMLLVLFLFVKCKNIENEERLELSRINEIKEIVETIIIEDSVNVFKNKKKSKMFCNELAKLEIYIPEKVKNGEPTPPPLPHSFYKISYKDLLSQENDNETFFNSKDSLFLFKQNFNSEILKIENDLFKNINLTTNEKEINKKKIGKPYDFYEMTIPIFSTDNLKAYIQLNHYCGRLCGSGKSFYLKKINGKWKIINKLRTWIS